MGEVDLNQAEVTLLFNGTKRVKRIDGTYQEAMILAKFVRVTLSDGTQCFAELSIIPPDIFPKTFEADQVVYEYVFLEAYGVANRGDGHVVHEIRSYI